MEFACPACESELVVSPDVRRSLLEAGCVFCGAAVAERAFAPA